MLRREGLSFWDERGKRVGTRDAQVSVRPERRASALGREG